MSDLERRRQAEYDTAKMLHDHARGAALSPMPRIASDIPHDPAVYREYRVDPLPLYPQPVPIRSRRSFLYASITAGAALVVGGLLYRSNNGTAIASDERPTGSDIHADTSERSPETSTLWPYPDMPWPDEQPIDVVGIRNNAPTGQFCIYGPTPPEYKPEVVERILQSYTSSMFPAGSPALKEGGQIWIDIPKYYRIDARFPLAFFIHESSAGTNPNWDGITMAPQEEKVNTSRDMGNISCTSNWVGKCFGRWRAYNTWSEGIEDWCKLMWAYAKGEVGGRGPLTTIEQIIPIYAPSSENNVPGYISAVDALVTKFK
jgi:hypothetical protein